MKQDRDQGEHPFDVLRRVSSGTLGVEQAQADPRWKALMDVAGREGLTPSMVYGAVLDGASGLITDDPRSIFERVALTIDRAGWNINREKQFVLDQYEALQREMEGTGGELHPHAQRVMAILKDIVYPDYFKEPTETSS